MGYSSVHFTHIAEIKPPTMAPDATNIASFCQKSKLPAKKARKRTTKASQKAPMRTVPAALDPNEFMATTLLNELISFSHRAYTLCLEPKIAPMKVISKAARI